MIRHVLPIRWVTAGLIGMVVCLTGCGSTMEVKNYQQTQSAALKLDEAVVVLGQPQLVERETELDFIDCVGEKLTRIEASPRVIPRDVFVDGMYPYFEEGTAPTSVEAVAEYAANPATRARMAEMNVRYLVWIDGFTETVDGGGSMSCTISPAGGGCLGWTNWTNEGAYNAEIWDLKRGVEASSFELDARGTSHLIGLVVPIPLLANVKGNACDTMAQWVAFAMRGS